MNSVQFDEEWDIGIAKIVDKVVQMFVILKISTIMDKIPTLHRDNG